MPVLLVQVRIKIASLALLQRLEIVYLIVFVNLVTMKQEEQSVVYAQFNVVLVRVYLINV